MNFAIETRRLTKRYKRFLALDEVSLQVKRGEIYGFIGLNGAGKSTMMRLLLGMSRPSQGKAYLLGERVTSGNHALWKKVGYVVDTPHAYPELTVRQNLELVRLLRHTHDGKAIDNVIELMALKAYSDQKAGKLSLGNKQRLGLAKALLHRPSVLLLDEPTNGLDPSGIAEVRELLRNLVDNHGVTVFLSSHLLSEIDKLTDRLGIVHQGRLIHEVENASLRSYLRKRLIVESRDLFKAEQALRNHGYQVTRRGESIILEEKHAIESPEKAAQILVQAGSPPTLLNLESETLEQYFLKMIHQS